MKITVSFHHLEHTPSLDERIQEKSQKLNKYLDGKTHVKWSCYVKDGNHHADVHLIGPHFEHRATAHSDSLYKTIDMVMDKVEKQLSKQKQKMRTRRTRAGKFAKEERVILEPGMAWVDYDEDYFADAS